MGSFPETYNDSKYSNELTVVISIIGREMLHDKNKEIDGLNKEFQRQIQVLVEDHKKEVDVSIRCMRNLQRQDFGYLLYFSKVSTIKKISICITNTPL